MKEKEVAPSLIGKKEEISLEIENPTDASLGTYVNLAFISHRNNEFCLDFLFVHPNRLQRITASGQKQPDVNKKATLRSRIVTTPEHAKRILAALLDNVRKYESTYGTIDLEQEVDATSSSMHSKLQ